MKTFDFSLWPERLAQAALPERNKHSFAITIRWYLSFCRRGRASVTVQSARDFIAWAESEKKPQPWQIEEWKEAINWFFREAKAEKEPSTLNIQHSTFNIQHLNENEDEDEDEGGRLWGFAELTPPKNAGAILPRRRYAVAAASKPI